MGRDWNSRSNKRKDVDRDRFARLNQGRTENIKQQRKRVSAHTPQKAKMEEWGIPRPRLRIAVENPDDPSILLQAVVEDVERTDEGRIIKALSIPWDEIVKELSNDWSKAVLISPERWEELVAAAFDRAGYDEVTITPRSGDHGRDVIAVKRGVISLRILGSVKAYKPGHLVKHDDVRALAHVVGADRGASKGIITTTSDFAPTITEDPFIAPLLPTRIQLLNGERLKAWMSSLIRD